MLQYLDIAGWVSQIGYFGLFAIVFIETGFFFGFFLPGDSLVVASGFLASRGMLNIWVLVPLLVLTAILGYAVAYWFGMGLGRWLQSRRDGFFFKKRYLLEAESFYFKYGALALVIGRFLPIIRTFVPIVAGMGRMSYKQYMIWNVIGAVLWGGVLCVLGYLLGALVPNAKDYILPSVVAIIIISVLPALWLILKNWKR
jgi:membrane-associated protein